MFNPEIGSNCQDHNPHGSTDSYILTTVFGALVLFFAGVSGKWKWPVATLVFIGIAMIFLIIVLQRIFTLPVIIN
jgi:hypothetical protein